MIFCRVVFDVGENIIDRGTKTRVATLPAKCKRYQIGFICTIKRSQKPGITSVTPRPMLVLIEPTIPTMAKINEMSRTKTAAGTVSKYLE